MIQHIVKMPFMLNRRKRQEAESTKVSFRVRVMGYQHQRKAATPIDQATTQRPQVTVTLPSPTPTFKDLSSPLDSYDSSKRPTVIEVQKTSKNDRCCKRDILPSVAPLSGRGSLSGCLKPKPHQHQHRWHLELPTATPATPPPCDFQPCLQHGTDTHDVMRGRTCEETTQQNRFKDRSYHDHELQKAFEELQGELLHKSSRLSRPESVSSVYSTTNSPLIETSSLAPPPYTMSTPTTMYSKVNPPARPVRPARRAKTPVLRIGQLEEQAKRKSLVMKDLDVDWTFQGHGYRPARANMLNKLDSTEALADHYRSLLTISRSSTPCSLRSVDSSTSLDSRSSYQPHRGLRKVKRVESLRKICESPELGSEDLHTQNTSDCDTLVGSDGGHESPDSTKAKRLDDVWVDEEGDVFVDAPEFKKPSLPHLTLPLRTNSSRSTPPLRTPSISRFTNAINGHRSPIPRFATPPVDTNVNLQICVDLMASELNSALHSTSTGFGGERLSGLGLGRQKAQLWLLIEAYEGLKQRIIQDGKIPTSNPLVTNQQRHSRLSGPATARSHVEATRITTVLDVLDNWLDALYATYGLLLDQQNWEDSESSDSAADGYGR